MRIFLDANILVSVLNKEYPLFSNSARIVSLADNKKFAVFTSPICLAIAFYFSEKKSGTMLAKKKIELLVSKLSITDVGKNEVLQSLQNKKVNDFEGGLEYYSAVSNQCDVIITEDITDFYFSAVPVLNSKAFIEKHLLLGN
jgi:predicted nucleic acid-binding protein